MSIKKKIYITLLTFTITPIIFIGLVSVNQVRGVVSGQVGERLDTLVRVEKERITDRIDIFKTELKGITSRTKFRAILAEYNETRSADLEALESIVLDAVKNIDGVNGVMVFDAGDNLIVESGDFNKDLLFDGGFMLSDFLQINTTFSVQGGQFVNGSPIKSNEGVVLGTLILLKNPMFIESIVKKHQDLGETGEFIIGTRDHLGDAVFLHEPRFPEEGIFSESISKNSKEAPIVQALEGNEGLLKDSFDYRGQEVVSYTGYIEQLDFGLVVKMDKDEIITPVRFFAYTIIMIFFIIFTLTLALSNLISRSISKPIVDLTGVMRRVEDDNLSSEVGEVLLGEGGEVGILARSFDAMRKKLRDSYEDWNEKVKDRTKKLEKKNTELEKSRKAILNALEDIEKGKTISEALSKDLEKFKLAVENTSDIVLITDPQGMVLYANPSIKRITGFSVEETVGGRAGELWGGLMDKGFYKKMWDTLNHKNSFCAHVKLRRKSGEEIVVDTNITPILGESGDVRFFVNIQRDITKEVLIDQAKTEFVSLASHQLRTPLTSIKWYSEMLLNGDAGKVSKKQKDYLGEIHLGNERMVELVNALLNVSRLELGTFDFAIKSVKPVKILKEEIEVLNHMADEKKIKIKLTNDPIKSIKMDDKMLRIIFSNLISNAIKYTPEKGVITVALKSRSRGTLLTVKDTGYGIPEGQKDRLFTKLFRADNIRQLDTTGTGLGLYIIKSILDNINGKISFTSKENKGTEFKVIIPKKINISSGDVDEEKKKKKKKK